MYNKIAKRLVEWTRGNKLPPDTVQIYPTNKCNLTCIFCAQRLGQYNVSEDVTKERWLEIADELCALGVKNILISGGGEPLASTSTIEMIELFKKNNLNGRMIHNGTLWNEDLIQRTIAAGWDNIVFSLDGLKDTHNKIRGKSFSIICQNIMRFNSLKNLHLTKVPRLEITTVLTKYNFKEIPQMVELMYQLKIKNYNLEPVCVNNPAVEKMKLNEVERELFLKEILPKAEEIAKKYNIFTNFHKLSNIKVIEQTGKLGKIIMEKREAKEENNIPKNLRLFLNSPCYEPWLWPKIEANGEVWPCSTVPIKENIKTKSFKEIWYGESFCEFRIKMLKGELSESCNNCVLTHLHTNRKIKDALKDETV